MSAVKTLEMLMLMHLVLCVNSSCVLLRACRLFNAICLTEEGPELDFGEITHDRDNARGIRSKLLANGKNHK